MGFVDKLKQVVTGKTDIERKQEAAANSEIRKEANAAALRERRTQAVRYAAEREKVMYEAKIKKLREPKQGFFSGASSYTSPFGQPRSVAVKVGPRKVGTVYVKKGKHYIKRTVRAPRVPRVMQPAQPQRMDILGAQNYGNAPRFRVI